MMSLWRSRRARVTRGLEEDRRDSIYTLLFSVSRQAGRMLKGTHLDLSYLRSHLFIVLQ